MTTTTTTTNMAPDAAASNADPNSRPKLPKTVSSPPPPNATGSVDEAAFPLAAQIPLQSFTLPEFPKTASRLRELTLTCDINLNEYQSTHLRPGTFEPSRTLPQSITHLNLELFSLGFPQHFLSSLAVALPQLRSLTLFNCLVDGIDENSRRDAWKFFENLPVLKELHVIDSFARSGFWQQVAAGIQQRAGEEEDLRKLSSPDPDKKVEQGREEDSSRPLSSPTIADGVGEGGLKVVEVSYTYRGYDEGDFLNRVLGEEWVGFIGGKGGLGLSFNFVPPVANTSEVEMQKEDGGKDTVADGILPYASDGRASQALKKRFEWLSADGYLSEIKVLNICMFALQADDIGHILYACASEDSKKGTKTPELLDLTVSVLLENKWTDSFLDSVAYMGVGKGLQSIEIIGVPSSPLAASEDSTETPSISTADIEQSLWKSEEKTKALAEACPDLQQLTMSILRSKSIGRVMWQRGETGTWSMQRVTAVA